MSDPVDTWTRPRWHDDALCSRADDPRRYDISDLPARLPLIASMERCAGCPVATECAREAREQQSSGVIRAGVPCSEATWRDTPRGALPREVMLMICDGQSPIVALIERLIIHRATSGRHRPYHAAIPELLALAVEHGHIDELHDLKAALDALDPAGAPRG